LSTTTTTRWLHWAPETSSAQNYQIGAAAAATTTTTTTPSVLFMAANQPARPAIELPQKKEKKTNPTHQLPRITKFSTTSSSSSSSSRHSFFSDFMNSRERILLRTTTTTTGRKKLTTPRSSFLPDLFP